MICFQVGFSQETKCKFEEKLISGNISIDLPCKYRKNITSYEEGYFISFTFPDTLGITIFDGTMAGVPILQDNQGYIVTQTDTVNNKIKTIGIKDGNYWREDLILPKKSWIRVMYIDIPLNKKDFYDKILDSAIVNK